MKWSAIIPSRSITRSIIYHAIRERLRWRRKERERVEEWHIVAVDIVALRNAVIDQRVRDAGIKSIAQAIIEVMTRSAILFLFGYFILCPP